MTTLHDDAFISSYRPAADTNKTRSVQGSDFIPVNVDLGSEKTIGRALLDAINADPDLAAVFGVVIDAPEAMTRADELYILDNITYIAFIRPASPIDILAYSGATHLVVALAGEVTYKPSVGIFRNYAVGGVVQLDVGFRS